jgi:hypothetical protein
MFFRFSIAQPLLPLRPSTFIMSSIKDPAIPPTRQPSVNQFSQRHVVFTR